MELCIAEQINEWYIDFAMQSKKEAVFNVPVAAVILAALACSVGTLIASPNDDGEFWTFPLVPAASIVALMISSSVRQLLTVALPMVVAYVVLSCIIFQNAHEIRLRAKWALEATNVMHDIQRQPKPPKGQLRHVEFDGFGGGFTMDFDVQIVEDPSDKLARYIGFSQMQRIDGIPCAAASVERRMATHLYYVVTQGYDWTSCS